MNYAEQLAAWAVDRAIETAKLDKVDFNGKGTEQIINMAKEYVAYVDDVAKKWAEEQQKIAEEMGVNEAPVDEGVGIN